MDSTKDSPSKQEASVTCQVDGPDESPFYCAFCELPLSDYSTLREHDRMHIASQPFMCIFCGKAFSTSELLQLHTRTHAPYKLREDYLEMTQEEKVKELIQAVVADDSKAVEKLLKSGCDPDQIVEDEKTTLLCMALRMENLSAARELLEFGANPNWKPSYFEGKESPPFVPSLSVACRNGNEDTMTRLVEAGADLEMKDFRKETCLYHAIRSKEPSLVQCLRDRGAKMTVENVCGNLPDLPDLPTSTVKKWPPSALLSTALSPVAAPVTVPSLSAAAHRPCPEPSNLTHPPPPIPPLSSDFF